MLGFTIFKLFVPPYSTPRSVMGCFWKRKFYFLILKKCCPLYQSFSTLDSFESFKTLTFMKCFFVIANDNFPYKVITITKNNYKKLLKIYLIVVILYFSCGQCWGSGELGEQHCITRYLPPLFASSHSSNLFKSIHFNI